MQDLNCLTPGQLLWAKGIQCSWWPAQVMDEKTISQNNIINKKIKGGVLVRFYGSYSYKMLHCSSWVDPLGDLSDFQESFKGKGSNHIRAFEMFLEEMLHNNKLNISSSEHGGVSKQSTTSSQGTKSDEKRAVKISACDDVNGEEPKQIQSQGMKKIKSSTKCMEAKKIHSEGKKKEVAEAQQIQSQGKRKEKPKSSEDEASVQIQGSRKRKEKSHKGSTFKKPVQIQKGTGKQKALKGSKMEEPVEIQKPEKGKEKAPESFKGKEPKQTRSPRKSIVKNAETSKGKEPQQIQCPGKRKEKASSVTSQRSQGKKKQKVSVDAHEVTDNSEKEVRQKRLMRQLGLLAPAGSPFGGKISEDVGT